MNSFCFCFSKGIIISLVVLRGHFFHVGKSRLTFVFLIPLRIPFHFLLACIFGFNYLISSEKFSVINSAFVTSSYSTSAVILFVADPYSMWSLWEVESLTCGSCPFSFVKTCFPKRRQFVCRKPRDQGQESLSSEGICLKIYGMPTAWGIFV